MEVSRGIVQFERDGLADQPSHPSSAVTSSRGRHRHQTRAVVVTNWFIALDKLRTASMMLRS